MKFNIIYILFMSLVVCFFFSCDKLPKNGYLDGQWQIITIIQQGDTIDVKPQQRYLSFQLDLFLLTKSDVRQRYYGRFERNGSYLRLYQISDMVENDKAEYDNKPINDTQLKALQSWGIYSADERFTIESINGDEMVLWSDSVKIYYRKF